MAQQNASPVPVKANSSTGHKWKTKVKVPDEISLWQKAAQIPVSPQHKINRKNIQLEIFSNCSSTELQKITTATAKILKTATEMPKELIKLMKIIKIQVLPRKCLSGRAVSLLREERGRSREGFFSAAENKAKRRAWPHHCFQPASPPDTCDRSCLIFPQDGNNWQPYFI